MAAKQSRKLSAAAWSAPPSHWIRESVSEKPGTKSRTARQFGLLAREFPDCPFVVGTSRKSFIGRLLGGAPTEQRLHGTMATITAAILQGAHIIRAHDVAAAAETARVADAIKKQMVMESVN
ncbi:MAG: dihydropteroate synthase [Pyrinomonadaceae bacterium]